MSIRIAANVETIEIAIVDLSTIHIEFLSICGVQVDDIDITVTNMSTD